MSKKILMLLVIACVFSAIATFVYAGDPSCGLRNNASTTNGCSALSLSTTGINTTQLAVVASGNISTSTVSFVAFCGNATGVPCMNSTSTSLAVCNATTNTFCDRQVTEEYLNQRFTNSSITNITNVSVATGSAPNAVFWGYNTDLGFWELYILSYTGTSGDSLSAVNSYIMADGTVTPNKDVMFFRKENNRELDKNAITWTVTNAASEAVVCAAKLTATGAIEAADCDNTQQSGDYSLAVDASVSEEGVYTVLIEANSNPNPNQPGQILAMVPFYRSPDPTVVLDSFNYGKIPTLPNPATDYLAGFKGSVIPAPGLESVSETTGSGDVVEVQKMMLVADYFDGTNHYLAIDVTYNDGVNVAELDYYQIGASTMPTAAGRLPGDTKAVFVGLNGASGAEDKPTAGGIEANNNGDIVFLAPPVKLSISASSDSLVFGQSGSQNEKNSAFFESSADLTTNSVNIDSSAGTWSGSNTQTTDTASATGKGSAIGTNPIFYGVPTSQGSRFLVVSGSNRISAFKVYNMTVTSAAIIRAVQVSGSSGGWGHTGDFVEWVAAGPSLSKNATFLDYFNTSITLDATNPNGTTRFTTDKTVQIATYEPDINILNFQLDWQVFNGSFDTTLGLCYNCSYDGANDPSAGGTGYCQAEVEKIWGMFNNYNLTITLTVDTPNAAAINFSRLALECKPYATAISQNSNCTRLSPYTDTTSACFTPSVPAAYSSYASVAGSTVSINLTSFYPNLTSMPFGTISPSATCEQIACEVTGEWVPGNTQEFTVNKTITVTAI